MITKIKWDKHDVLGNLELDFSKPDGSTYNTIVLAGENGTGKTTILETLAAFLNLGSIEAFDYIKYTLEGISYTLSKSENNPVKYGHHSRKNEINGFVEEIVHSMSLREDIGSDPKDLCYYGFAYSKARSGFNTRKVQSTTTQQLDSDKYEIDSEDDFTSIKQLIVDIDTQDNSEWMRITKLETGMSFSEFSKYSKLHRFKEAFNNFFDNIKFDRINNEDSEEIKILFDKHGKEISIDDLSTGEKQIVFRGAHLLKNNNSMSGGIILVDEPELSMHPKWQQKVLEYYRKLFNKEGVQNVQMIIATHSEYVLRSALEDTENVLIITLSNDNGTIHSKETRAPAILPTITSAETNYLAFGIISTDYHIQLYGYLQSKAGGLNVKQCDEYIAKSKFFKQELHAKESSFTHPNRKQPTEYKTLPTYIRNLIHHPDPNKTYTEEELKCSIKLLIELCK